MNIISQVDLVMKDHGDYSHIYDRELNIVTNRSTTSIEENLPNDVTSTPNRLLVTYTFKKKIHFGLYLVFISQKDTALSD